MALITAATAREFAAKGNAAKRERLEQLRDTVATLTESNETDYATKVLVRVRAQLDLVNIALTKELERPAIDAQAVDRLAAAQSRLADQERILDGRPMPGSLKPSQNKPARSRVSMPDPAPTTPRVEPALPDTPSS